MGLWSSSQITLAVSPSLQSFKHLIWPLRNQCIEGALAYTSAPRTSTDHLLQLLEVVDMTGYQHPGALLESSVDSTTFIL